MKIDLLTYIVLIWSLTIGGVVLANNEVSTASTSNKIEAENTNIEKKEVMSNKIDLEKLKKLIEYFEAEPKVEYNPYPQYTSEMYESLEFLGPDYKYLEHYDKIKRDNIAIENMTLDELSTMFTFYMRGERFCDGCIAGGVEDGTILRLLKRLYKLQNP